MPHRSPLVLAREANPDAITNDAKSGEIFARGPNIMREHFAKPETTAEILAGAGSILVILVAMTRMVAFSWSTRKKT
jgi:acyl-CoA synthetase (AMP-forming)/AMP-acid ligase II